MHAWYTCGVLNTKEAKTAGAHWTTRLRFVWALGSSDSTSHREFSHTCHHRHQHPHDEAGVPLARQTRAHKLRGGGIRRAGGTAWHRTRGAGRGGGAADQRSSAGTPGSPPPGAPPQGGAGVGKGRGRGGAHLPRRRSSSAGPRTPAHRGPSSGGRPGLWTPAHTCHKPRPGGGRGRARVAEGAPRPRRSPRADSAPPPPRPTPSHLGPTGRKALGEGAEAASHASPHRSVPRHERLLLAPMGAAILGPSFSGAQLLDRRAFRPSPFLRFLFG